MSKRSVASPRPVRRLETVTTLPPSLLLPKPCSTRNAARRSPFLRPSGSCSTPASSRPFETNCTGSFTRASINHALARLHARSAYGHRRGADLSDEAAQARHAVSPRRLYAPPHHRRVSRAGGNAQVAAVRSAARHRHGVRAHVLPVRDQRAARLALPHSRRPDRRGEGQPRHAELPVVGHRHRAPPLG